MPVLLGAIKNNKSSLLNRAKKLIALDRKMLKMSYDNYFKNLQSFDDKMYALQMDIEKVIKVSSDKDYNYYSKASTEEILNYWIKKLNK
jgi:hypothetical protein